MRLQLKKNSVRKADKNKFALPSKVVTTCRGLIKKEPGELEGGGADFVFFFSTD